jgi:MFS family permease
MHKGDHLSAYRIWKRIRGVETRESCQEFYDMKASLEMEELEVRQGRTRRFPWIDLFTNKRARRALVYANIMIFLGQFTGINAVMYYMSVLMSQVGFDSTQANYMSLVGGGALLLGTIPAIFYMEICGRRFWALTMLPGFFIGLILVGISYELPITNTAAVQGVYLTGLILYEGFFGCYACLTWVIPSEVYPTYLRSYGMTISSGWVFLASFIVTYNFSSMQAAMTKIGLALGFYGGIAVLGWFYQLLFMPETKNKTLEEIDLIFEKPTIVIVKENIKNSKETCKDLMHLRFRKVATEVQMVR